MPGFVDVSGMTYEDVRRMGHADDYDEPAQRYNRAPARNNTVLQVGYSVSDVWAAACAAQRVNGGYFKEIQYAYNETTGRNEIVKTRNRDIMMEFLQNPSRILVEDVEQGEECRKFLDQDITFRALAGKLTEFDSSTKKVLAVQDRFYTVSNRYELAVAACLPSSFIRAQARQNTASRLAFCRPIDAEVGTKVTLNVEVLQSIHSQKYGMFFINAVTEDNIAVSFGSKEKFDAGIYITIQGKVKSHGENATQLNYTKVL